MELADAELVAEFVVEAQEGLANIEQQMLAIEAGGADLDLVNAVFRTMHSIKGSAGFLGLNCIGTLAHSLEEVLNRLRNQEIPSSSELVTSVLHAADFMKGLIDAVDSSNDADITGYIASLQQFRTGAPPAEQPEPATVAAALDGGAAIVRQNETDASPATASSAGGSSSEAMREFLIECYENLDQMDQSLLTLEQHPASTDLLRGIFRTMHTLKGGAGFLGLGSLEKLAHAAESVLSKLRDGALALSGEIMEVLLATVDKCREGLHVLETSGSDAGFDPGAIVQRLLGVNGDQAKPAVALPSAGDRSSPAPVAVPAPVDRPASPDASPVPAAAAAAIAAKPSVSTADGASSDKSPLSAGDSTVRVDVALLDKLMTRVGELVLARNQILQHTNGLDDAAFVSTAQRLNLITAELQESVMKTRMQPIGNVWAKFPRVVRDLAAQLGKQVRIDMEGKETELDKTIVEAIKDPLTHLVRNSVDHGIESPGKRQAAGKPAEGRLLLRAYHEGGQVNIEITDDGDGLNLDRIRKKAVERGIMTAEQANRTSDRDAAQLIFAPGFSTAEQVTSVSGRGVGMDVVRTNIERIGGTIDLQTQSGQGTTVKIKIPLTLAIIPALIVTDGGDRYAIPQVSLLELLRLDGSEAKRGIEYVHGAPVYRLRGKLLPIVHLSERLGLRNDANISGDADRVVNIIVLRANDRQFGLIVDKVNDTEEIVVKPLSRQLKGLSEYAGATIMGDGAVALILDVMGLAVAAGLAAESRDQSASGVADAEERSNRSVESLLVVDLGDNRRFALPTSMIARLEKVSGTAIEYAEGREVIQYRGAILPLLRLHEVFGGGQESNEESRELQIVVYADQEHRCGFVVHGIVDIVETELKLSTPRQEGDLLGTTIIQQRVTDVLNLRRLARRSAAPKFAAMRGEV